MTSKNLYINLLKEDTKRRTWAWALITLLFFFALPIYLMLNLGQVSTDLNQLDYLASKTYGIRYLLSLKHELMVMLTAAIAIICGLSSFSYLHSKKKVDFYHSIPVSRGKLFAVQYAGGVLVFVAAYGVNLLLCLLIAAVNGAANGDALSVMLPTFGINLVMYLLIYSVVVTAVMMTGNMIVSILGSFVFLLYMPVVLFLIEGLNNMFFRSYYSNSELTIKVASYTSPFMTYGNIIERVDSLDKMVWFYVLVAILEAAAVSGLAYLLFKRRPSEAAGKAMAFHKSKTVIKVLLVIPFAICGGVFFHNIGNGDAWMVFGILSIGLLSHAIIEIIYQFDFKSALAHKKHILFCLAAAALITSIFRFDLFRYDEYLPKQEKIASMSMTIGGVDDWIEYPREIMDSNGVRYNYVNSSEYQLEHMNLTNLDGAYDIIKLGIANIISVKEGNYITENRNNESETIAVKYKLKSGRTIWRNYWVTMEQAEDEIAILYDNPEYKTAVYPVLSFKAEDLAYLIIENEHWKLDTAQMKEVLTAYQEELSNLTIDDRRKMNPIGAIRFVDKEAVAEADALPTTQVSLKSNILGNCTEYPVYPSFERTIQLLADHGVPFEDTTKLNEITKIQVVDKYRELFEYRELQTKERSENELSFEDQYKELEEDESVFYTEADKIKQIMERAVKLTYLNGLMRREKSVEVIVTTGLGAKEHSDYYVFPLGDIPEFVKKDIKYDEHRSNLGIKQ